MMTLNDVVFAAPKELALGDVYVPPLLISAIVGLIFASLTTRTLNRFRLYRYFAMPTLVELALVVIYTVLVGTFLIPS